MGSLNGKVDPCRDFYEFANGAWLSANPIPPSMARWSRRAAGREVNKRQLRSILEDVAAKTDWPVGSMEQLLGAHYASCMDEAGINAAGLTPLSPLLAEVDGVQTQTDVQRVVRRLHELAIPALFGATGGVDYHRADNFIENIVPGNLGLPDRDYYLKPDARFTNARAEYLLHVANVLKLGGMRGAQATQGANDVLALEKHLAEASLDSAAAAEPTATDHKMTFTQLKQLAPRFDWDAYFDEAKLPHADVNVAQPQFVQRLNQELNDTPVAVWRSYLRWQVLDSASPWLSEPFVDESFRFKEQYLAGAKAMKPRALRCVESTDALFGELLGRKYVELHFSAGAKAKSQEIARALLAVLKRDVAAVQWMTAKTRQKVLQKVAVFNPQLGYPGRWKDASALALHRDSFWENTAAGRKFNVAENRKQVGKATDRNLWQLSPSSPDAYIDFQLIEMVLPAGFLQPPTFNLEATDAVNYGAFGAALAHDMTHAIDVTGAATDILGQPQNWWTAADRKGFDKRSQCLVGQFHVEGKRVLNEAVGDVRGLRMAYVALEKSMKQHPVPVVDGFTPEQQFFIAWAQVRGEAVAPETQRQLAKTDIHPIATFRVIGALSNLPEFQEAFSCEAGAQMVRLPEKRCPVW